MENKVVLFLGSKGGVGCSFVSLNTGVALSEMKKSVLLIEVFDNVSSIPSMLGVEEKPLSEITTMFDRITPEIIKGYFAKHISGVETITVGINTKLEAIIKLIGMCKTVYDYIIIDIGSKFNEKVLPFFKLSNVFLLIVTPDVISLKARQFITKFVSKHHFHPDMLKIVINKINKNTYNSLKNTNVISSINYNLESVEKSINDLKPIVYSAHTNPTGRAIRKLAIKLTEENNMYYKQHIEKPEKKELNKTTIESDIKTRVYNIFVEELKKRNPAINPSKLIATPELKKEAREVIEDVFSKEAKEITDRDTRAKLIQEIIDNALGLGPLEELLRNPEITEIMVNGKDKVYVEKKGKLQLTDKKFASEKQLVSIIERIVIPIGRRVDESSPYVDARLSDGSRINAIIRPLSVNGPTLTIRKFTKEKLTIADLIGFGSITKEVAEFLKKCVILRKNIIISGGTGSGKTTFLNVLSSFIPDNERIITIEDSAELQLTQEHLVTLETRPPNIEGAGEVKIRDLLKNALRMRPDRIIIGECRGGEALDMLQAMNTGHDGSLTTLHSNSPRDTLSRLETMVLMAGMELPLRAIREQIASAVDLIIHQSRFSDGTRKITHITEVVKMEGEIITTQDLFLFKQTGVDINGNILGSLKSTGITPIFELT